MPLNLILSVLSILYIIAVSQALLIAFYLVFQRRGHQQSRVMLALLMVVFVVFLTGTFLLLFFSGWRHIYYAHLANLSIFLAPPLLYFYYRSLLDQHFKLTYRSLVHFVPFVVIFALMFYIIVFQLNRNFVFRPFGIVMIAALFVQSLFYLNRMFIEKRTAFTNGTVNKAKWFGYLFGGVFFVFAFKLITFLVWNVLGFVDVCIFLTGMFFILSFIMINMLVLYGLSNPESFINYFKYQASPLSGIFKDKHFSDLLSLFEEKQLYLDPLLTLDKLARPLQISGKQLSQLINENAGYNFNDFVNQYRIKEAQRLLETAGNQQPNILEIAYQVGFNSKSTFNTAFKKFTTARLRSIGRADNLIF